MKAKTLNSLLIIILIVLGVVACYFEYKWVKSFTAPEFELVNSDITEKYTYSTNDGDSRQSVYNLAWHHQQFKKTRAIFFDKSNGKWANIRDEYYDDIYAQMPPSRYGGWYRHCMIVWIILLFAATIAVLYFGGLPICDSILYLKIKANPTFEECGYFLFGDRTRAHSDKVKSWLPYTATTYIQSKITELQLQYSPSLVALVLQMLQTVSSSASTNIPFVLKIIDNTTDQHSYLESTIKYWESQIGINPEAENNIKLCKSYLKETYYDIPKYLLTGDNMAYHVKSELEKLFTKIMGSEIFKFDAYAPGGYLQLRGLIPIEVDITALNTTNYSTVSVRSLVFPGISFRFEIYKNVGGQRQRLWSAYLPYICKYTFNTDDFSEETLYRTAINQTLSSFTDVIFKKK